MIHKIAVTVTLYILLLDRCIALFALMASKYTFVTRKDVQGKDIIIFSLDHESHTDEISVERTVLRVLRGCVARRNWTG